VPYDPETHGPRRAVGPGFHARVYDVVAQVPDGFVTTYGDVAEALGHRRAARQVGFALAATPDDRDIPWHRVVNSAGKISFAPTTRQGRRQARLLRAEGVAVVDGRIAEFRIRRFKPPAS